MSNSSKNNTSSVQLQAAISVTSEKFHLEVTLPTQQAKRLLHPVGWALSLLTTAALTAFSVNPSLLHPSSPLLPPDRESIQVPTHKQP